jgi:hypothetical protein
MDLNEVEEELEDNSFYDISQVLENRQALKSEQFVSTADDTVQPSILHQEKLYLERYFNLSFDYKARFGGVLYLF